MSGQAYSVYELCRRNPLRVDDAVVRSFKPVSNTGPTAAVIILIDYPNDIQPMLASLINLDYKETEIIAVCANNDLYREYAPMLQLYDHMCNLKGTFNPEQALTGGEMILAGMQSVEAEYVCFLFAGDILHPQSVSRGIAALEGGDQLCARTPSYVTGNNHWTSRADTTRPDSSLFLLKAQQVLPMLGGYDDIICPREALWDIEEKLTDRTIWLDELLHFHLRAVSEASILRRYAQFKKRG